jgi:hypothetical protein
MRLILPAHYGYSCLFIVCGLSCLLIMAIPAYSLYAAYPACLLWLLHANARRSNAAQPPSSMTPAHFIMASPEGAMSLIIKFTRQAIP